MLNTFWTKIPKSSHSDAYCYIQSTYILLAWSSSILEARWSGSCFSNRSSSGEVGNTVFDLTETSMYVLQKFWHVVNYLYVVFNWNMYQLITLAFRGRSCLDYIFFLSWWYSCQELGERCIQVDLKKEGSECCKSFLMKHSYHKVASINACL